MKKSINFLLLFVFLTNIFTTNISAYSGKSISKSLIFNKDENFEKLIKNAFDLYREKKFEQSLAVCAKAAEINPKDFRISLIIGLIYFEQKKFQQSAEEFTKSIALKPTVQGYMFKANIEEKLGKIEESVSDYRKAIELKPDLAEAYWAIGEILIGDEKRRDEAFAAYQKAVEINPQFMDIYEYLGEKILYTKKDAKLAEFIFRKQLAADEKKMMSRFALGRLLVEQGRLKEAREIWEGRTSDKDKTFPNFITLLERAEKLKQATDELAKNPNDTEKLLQMGFAVMEGDSWVSDGRQERAIEYFAKALKLKPTLAMAQYGICKAYIQIANIFQIKNKNVDEELAKLKKLSPRLAQEMEEYRKTYSGGIKVASPIKISQ